MRGAFMALFAVRECPRKVSCGRRNHPALALWLMIH